MIEVLPQSQSNIIGFEASDKLTDQDYKDVLVPRLEALLKEHSKVNLLLYMDKAFHGWEVGAAWDDAKFALEFRGKFDKMAIVGGPKWFEWGVKLDKHFMGAQLKTFSGEQNVFSVNLSS